MNIIKMNEASAAITNTTTTIVAVSNKTSAAKTGAVTAAKTKK